MLRPSDQRLRPGLSFRYSADTTINFEQTGRGARSVIFLHGFAASIRNWDDLRNLLPLGFSYYFLDLKGFGYSSKPPASDYGLWTQAGIVRAFLRDQGLGKVTVVGHSYGGGIALLLALLMQDDGDNSLDSLILIDSAGRNSGLPFFVESLRNPVLRTLLRLVPRHQQVRQALRRAFYNHDTLTPTLVGRYEFFYALPGAQKSFRQAAEQALPEAQEDIERRLSTIQLPSIVIWGGEDRILWPGLGEELAAALGQAPLILIPECGHVPQEERPDLTIAKLQAFLQSLPGANRS